MAADPRRVKELFAAALDLTDVPARQAFLERQCAGDAELRRHLNDLLHAHELPQPALDQPWAALAPASDTAEEQPGIVLAGRYKLHEKIGEGGMGSVWLAQQTEPVKRTVAVKLIRRGDDSRAVLARFEAERQALALMDHPNIARVLDAGTTERGAPFFVMELVKGVPITRFCDERKLTPRQRLELFIPVCQAIQHAHQKGIIHRDIKPSNVLVALYDDRPVPKVIDFGLAKATGTQLTEQSLLTGFGALVGTPLYMSPEQATLNNLDIDTRSDVYSLGVLLYELLTGGPPFRRKELARAGMLEILRVIREEEPPRPSTRLSSDHALPSLAANRSTEPARLTRLVRGEIDWIVMKALEKERSRRYETANGFVADIQRYLADEPVQAGPPSASYRLRKFVKRNKGRVLAAGLLLLALVAGLVGTTVGLLQADRARQDEAEQRARAEVNQRKAEESAAAARRATDEAKKSAAAAMTANAQAQKRLRLIENGIEILASVFFDVDPKSEEKEGASLRVVLGRRLGKAAEQLTEETVGDKTALGRLQTLLGRSLMSLGHYQQAEAVLTRARQTLEAAVGADHPRTLACKYELAGVYQYQGKYARAEALYKGVLASPTSGLPSQFFETLAFKNGLADLYRSLEKYAPAEALFKEVLEGYTRRLGPEDANALTVKNNLVGLYLAEGKEALAETLARDVVERSVARRGPGHTDTLNAKRNLAQIYQTLGKSKRARVLCQEVVKGYTAQLGVDHPRTLAARNDLALLYAAQGNFPQAQTLLQTVLKAQVDQFGTEHASTRITRKNLADLYRSRGEYVQAEALFQAVLATEVARLGPEHLDTLTTKSQLAALYQQLGNYRQAEVLHNDVLAGRTERFGPEHPKTVAVKNNLAILYRTQGRYAQAEALFNDALATLTPSLGADHPHVLLVKNNLGLLYHVQGKDAEAERLYRDVLRISLTTLGPRHPDTLLVKNNLADLYRYQGKPAAEGLYREVLQGRSERLGPDHPDTLETRNSIALLHLRRRQYAEAEKLLQEVLRQRLKRLGAHSQQTLNTKNSLAALYRAQGKYAAALPLAEEVVADSTALRGAGHPSTLVLKNNLASLYWSMKKLDRSIPLFEEVVEGQRQKLGADHPDTIFTLANLGVNYRDAGRLDDALRCLEEAWARQRKLPGPVPPDLAALPEELVQTCERARQCARAEPLYRAFWQQARRQFGADDARTIDHQARLGLNLLQQKKHAEAEVVLRECLAFCERKQPDDWGGFNLRSLLGAALLGQKKYAAAEPLLQDGYQGLKKRRNKIPAAVRQLRVAEALERLVALYEATDNTDEAARWRKQLEAQRKGTAK
jgi:tetratricopeptide (TPR) repeat protein